MALEPLDLQPWVDRLKGITVPQVRTVTLAATAALAKEFGNVAPAIYVLRQQLRARDPANSNAASGLIRQTLDVRVQVALVTQRYGDALGGKSLDALRDLRLAVWDRLIGWTPPGAFIALALDYSEDGDPASSFLYGIDQFYTQINASKRET